MGSITHITDRTEILNTYQYDAWGEVVSEREEVGNRFKFNGQQLDSITGQYYLRARYYNPVIGRFTQEDTYRGDGLNLYAYCGNNPVYYVDPTGHESSNANSYKDAKDNSLSIIEGGGKAEPDFGKKLDYLFGKATGSQHNLERTAGMESELGRKMGLPDTPENREYIKQEIRNSYFDDSSISNIEQMSYVAKEKPGKPTEYWTGTTRETFIMGPNRGAILQTLWDDNVLKNIIVRGGKGTKSQTIEEILSQIKKQ